MSEAPQATPAARPSAWVLVAIVLCFFVSGATSLILETAWSKQLSYLLGMDLYAAATTIIAYMVGLGIGSLLAVRFAHRLARPLRAYAALQIAIGLIGMASVPLLLQTQPIFELMYRLNSHHTLFLAGRFLVTFTLLLPVTILMGMTLPIVIGAYSATRAATAGTAGLLYGVNTLGAVAGTAVAGFGLVPSLGLTKTCVVAGALDLVLAVVVYVLFRRISRKDSTPVTAPVVEPWTIGPGLAVPVLLSGAMALALELCWFRLLGQTIGPTVQAFAITLSVFLCGVGLGSLLGSRVLRFFPSGEAALVTFLLLGAVCATLPVQFLDRIPVWYTSLWELHDPRFPELSLMVAQGTIAAGLMLPTTLATGAVFPAAIHAYRERYGAEKSISAISGKLYFVNTVGSATGTLLWAFWVLPALGTNLSIASAAGCAVVGSAMVVATRPGVVAAGLRSPLGLGTIATAAVLFVLVQTAPKPDALLLNSGVYTTIRNPAKHNKWVASRMHPKAELLFAKDGLNGSVAVVKNRDGSGNIDLALSGKWEASTHYQTRLSLLLLGHMPVLLAKKQPETSLVIGFGTGMTSGSLLRYPFMKAVTIVEIEPAVLEASQFFNEYNHEPMKDPRTRVVLEDGRTHIAYGDEKYDIITSDPIHPWFKGVGNLYTREYYQQALGKLNPGGIFCQWIPSTMSPKSFKSILLTLRTTFPHLSFLFAGREVVALAGMEPIVVEPETLRQRMADPAVLDDLKGVRLPTFERVLELLNEDLRPATAQHFAGTINTDDNVFLEHHLPWDMFRGEVTYLRSERRPAR